MASSSSSKSPMKKIIVKTSDGDLFEVEESVAMEFAAVKSFFEDNLDSAENTVTPLQVSTAVLNRLITYCDKHNKFRSNSTPKDEVQNFDREFVKEDSNEMIMEMVVAANYLEVKDLLELLEGVAAERIQNRSVEYVRDLFGIENDFTPAEEEENRKEFGWAFEGVDKDDTNSF